MKRKHPTGRGPSFRGAEPGATASRREARPEACRLLVNFALWEREVGFPEVSRDIAEEVDLCRTGGQCRAPEICRARESQRRSPAVVAIDRDSLARRRTAGSGLAKASIVVALDSLAASQEDEAGNRVSRLPLSIETLRAKRDGLTNLFLYWEAVWQSGGRLSDIDPVRLIQLGLLDRMHLINADDPDPRGFVLELRGPNAPSVPGSLRNGDRLTQHPVGILAASLLDDYERVRRRGEPQYARVDSCLFGENYRYRRLILPLTMDGSRVDRLLVAIAPM